VQNRTGKPVFRKKNKDALLSLSNVCFRCPLNRCSGAEFESVVVRCKRGSRCVSLRSQLKLHRCLRRSDSVLVIISLFYAAIYSTFKLMLRDASMLQQNRILTCWLVHDAASYKRPFYSSGSVCGRVRLSHALLAKLHLAV